MLPVLKPLPKTFGPKTAPSLIDLWPVFVSSLETLESSIFRHVKFPPSFLNFRELKKTMHAANYDPVAEAYYWMC